MTRVRQLIETLELQPHPEGGWYREVFRSTAHVTPADGRPARSAMTSIYFLLEAGQHSRWHRVVSDEVWVHLEGTPNGEPEPRYRHEAGMTVLHQVVQESTVFGLCRTAASTKHRPPPPA